MRINGSKKKSQEVLEELYDRFMDGEQFTIQDIVKDYFPTKDPFIYLQATRKVKGWIQNLKHKFRTQDGLWFGNIDDQNHYGIPNTPAEYIYSLTRYYTLVKGIVVNASALSREGKQKGMIEASNETLMLPRLIVKKKDKE